MSLIDRLFEARGWSSPDWRLRLRAVSRLRDRARLLRLALADEHPDVRLAAVGALGAEADLATVVADGACPPSRRLALARIQGLERRLALALDASLPEEFRLILLEGLPPDERLAAAYTPAASLDLRLAVLARVADPALHRRVLADETDLRLRLAAASRLDDEKLCAELALCEPSPRVRGELHRPVHDPALLVRLYESEDDPALRLALAHRLRDDAHILRLLSRELDHGPRSALLANLHDQEALLSAARDETHEATALRLLARLHAPGARADLAHASRLPAVRVAALASLPDPSMVAPFAEASPHPELRWLAARRLGRLPVDLLRQIRTPQLLRRLVEHETDDEIAAWLATRTEREDVLRLFATHERGPVRLAAQRRAREAPGPAGLRFVPIPGRPYELSLFLVTRAQVRAVLGPGTLPAGDPAEDDLPATGLSPALARAFCARLSLTEERTYRLPSLEEWRHATLTDEPGWLTPAPSAGSAALAARLHLAASGPRSAELAWPNPWGLLDMLGNVAVWVDERPPFWARRPDLRDDPLASRPPLPRPGGSSTPSFACAAGLAWTDAAPRRHRLERLVSLPPDDVSAGHPQVGFRVLRTRTDVLGLDLFHRLILLPETAAGLTPDDVVAALRARKHLATPQVETGYRVAPVTIMRTRDYEELRLFKSVLEQAGAQVRVQPDAAADALPAARAA